MKRYTGGQVKTPGGAAAWEVSEAGRFADAGVANVLYSALNAMVMDQQSRFGAEAKSSPYFEAALAALEYAREN